MQIWLEGPDIFNFFFRKKCWVTFLFLEKVRTFTGLYKLGNILGDSVVTGFWSLPIAFVALRDLELPWLVLVHP